MKEEHQGHQDHVTQSTPKVQPMYSASIFWVCVAVALVSASTYLSIKVWSENSRYYLSNAGDGTIHKIDRRSGDTWTLKNGQTIKHYQEIVLPSHEVSQIEGRAGYDPEISSLYQLSSPTEEKDVQLSSKFSGNLYNGTEWHITRIEVTISNSKKAGTLRKDGEKIESWSRSFRANVFIDPKDNGTFSFDTIEGHRFEASDWGINKAWGHKIDDDAM